MLRAALFGLVVLSSSLLVVREADACSGRCGLAKFPADGRTLPAGFTLLPVPFGGKVEIFDASGKSVFDGTTRSGLVDFGIPLPEGKYKLAHELQGCGDTATERSFVVGPAAPLPSASGAVTSSAVVQEPARPAEDYIGACDPYGAPRLASANVWLTPSTELMPYLPLARFEVVVDGTSIGLPQYVTESGPVAQTHLVVPCETPPQGWRQSGYVVTEGSHQIEIRGELVDGTKLPVARNDVTVVCGTGASSGEPSSLSSAPAAGCSTSSARSAFPSFGIFALLALIGVAARRRP